MPRPRPRQRPLRSSRPQSPKRRARPRARQTTEASESGEAPAATRAPKPADDTPARPRTAPIPVVEELELDVAELGLADRLGLGEVDPDDEVGPTS